MQEGYITALAALGGSIVGSFTSLLTTWLTQNGQRRTDRANREAAKREALYGQFIDESARLLGIVLQTESDDPGLLVPLLAMQNRMILFASPPVLAAAGAVIQLIAQLNLQAPATLRDLADADVERLTRPMKTFGTACRAELDAIV